jgi:ribonucleoside-diphosphate reductase alpha chain
MAAVQPFLSGAISKSVNMPEAATAEEIEQVYLEGWKLGLKAIAIYRDNSKRSQPLSTGRKKDGDAVEAETIASLRAQLAAAQAEAVKPHRRRLPAERAAVTHKFDIAGHEGYITVGLYPEGQPGEIFLKMAKEGSTVSGLMDTFATSVSLALQYGVPLRDLVNKFAHVRFEPSGFTGNSEIPIAKSIVDYIFRWLGARFLAADDKAGLGLQGAASTVVAEAPAGFAAPISFGAPVAAAPAPLGPSEGESTGEDVDVAPADESRALPVVEPAAKATGNGNGNGHKNGNGNGGGGGLAGLSMSLGTTTVAFTVQEDAPSCAECGSIMVRNGSCYKCMNCGSTSGCS